MPTPPAASSLTIRGSVRSETISIPETYATWDVTYSVTARTDRISMTKAVTVIRATGTRRSARLAAEAGVGCWTAGAGCCCGKRFASASLTALVRGAGVSGFRRTNDAAAGTAATLACAVRRGAETGLLGKATSITGLVGAVAFINKLSVYCIMA